MSFINVHKRNILEKIPINKREITPGDIVLFRYKGKDGISEKIALCLGGLRGKFATEDKLTAIDLDKFSPDVFKRFLGLLEKPKLVNEERKGKIITSLLIEAETESDRQQFYNTKVKKFLQYDAYRTYIDKKITVVKLVSYDYSNKQLGLKNEDLLQDTDT
tara:strand:- start:14 stop:496 length:483 start_codon:yes stop_codon:yes gene_type:complete